MRSRSPSSPSWSISSTPISIRGSGTARAAGDQLMATQSVLVRSARPRTSAGLWSDAWGRLRKNRLAILGLILVATMLFVGIFGPVLAPWPYGHQDLKAVF